MHEQPRALEIWHWFGGCAKIAIYCRIEMKFRQKLKTSILPCFFRHDKKNEVLIHECSKRGKISWKKWKY